MTLPRSLVRTFAAAGLALLAGACSNTSLNYPTAVLRPAIDAPERFLREDGSTITGTPGAAPCTSPIMDPRSGARLLMQRAYQDSGDYTVPPGRYGVGTGELLRVDCATGLAVGVVRG
jgi:hypothetical protein